MDAATPPKRNSASLLLGFALALLVVFLMPANNRRVGMSLVRVMFDFNYGDIDVCGQLRGCTIMMVPTSGFSDRIREKRDARAKVDPDWLVVELADSIRYAHVPDAELFAGHPYQAWTALRIAGATHHLHMYKDEPHYKGLYQPDRIEHVLQFVRDTQSRYPNNGALWLAEGLILNLQGHESDALVAWEQAAERPHWDDQPAAALHIFDVARQFMTEVDAGMLAYFAGPDSIVDVDGKVHSEIGHYLARSIEEQDEQAVARLFSLIARLRDCRWTSGFRSNYQRFLRSWELSDAIRSDDGCFAGKLNADLSDLLYSDNDHALIWAWAATHLPTDVFYDLRESEIDLIDSNLAYREHNSHIDHEYLLRFDLAKKWGVLSLISMAFLVCASMLYFCVRGQVETKGAPFLIQVRRLRWIRTAGASLFSYWLFYNALKNVLQPVGLGSRKFLDDKDNQTILVFTLCCVALTVAGYWLARIRIRQQIIWALSLILCLGVMFRCVYYRSLFAEGLLYQVRHLCTGELLPDTLIRSLGR